VKRALQLAGRLHALDHRQREPYVNHLLRVALRIICHYETRDADTICAALLHDAVEDHAYDLSPDGQPGAFAAEIASRHDSAASAMGTIARALDTIPLLCAEVRRLRARLVHTLTDLHNLIAAARATLGAHADGEEDALYYLRDELDAQGQLPPQHRKRP
jgi:(p)ppGpp synthase/HD superfamily hydrolase